MIQFFICAAFAHLAVAALALNQIRPRGNK
jgi:hypothetical protein